MVYAKFTKKYAETVNVDLFGRQLKKEFKIFKYYCFQWSMRFARPSQFTGMLLKMKVTNISSKHYRLANPKWREADQWAIYKTSMTEELN